MLALAVANALNLLSRFCTEYPADWLEGSPSPLADSLRLDNPWLSRLSPVSEWALGRQSHTTPVLDGTPPAWLPNLLWSTKTNAER